MLIDYSPYAQTMALNSQSPLPLYRQLAERIRADVADAVYAVNSKIPSEHALAKHYQVGRPTVRQATDLLVREGLLQRKRGSGTYVLPLAQPIDLFSLAGTSAAFEQSELDADISLLSAPERLSAEQPLPAAFGQRPAYRLQRLSRVANEPVLLEVIYLDAELFPHIDRQVMGGDSLSQLVRTVYFLEASSAEQRFTIIYPDKQTAHILQTNAGIPLLHVGRTLHFGEQRAAIYCDIYCRTDRFHFSQTIQTASVPTVPAHSAPFQTTALRTPQTEGITP